MISLYPLYEGRDEIIPHLTMSTNPKVNTALSSTLVQMWVGEDNLRGYYLINPDTAIVYILGYDAASTGDVTVGVTTPKFCFGLPAGSGSSEMFDDENEIEILKGLVVCASSSATSAVAPGTAAVVNFMQ